MEAAQEVIATNVKPLAERLGRGGRSNESAASTPGADPRFLLTELESLLGKEGCPACRHVEEAERSFFSWFEIESFSTAQMHARLRASMGLCAAHTRRLVDEVGEGHIMTTVMRQAVAGAAQCLGGDDPLGRCPACEATGSATERAIRLFVDGLHDPGNARLYAAHNGMCLPHVVVAAQAAEPATLKLLVERLSQTFEEFDEGALVELLGAADRDRSRRRRWREQLPENEVAESTVAGMCERLAVEACPVCLSTGRIERDYVRWFVARSREHDPSIRSDPGELCSLHVHDVALADHAVAADAARRQRAARRAELRRLLDALSELPASGRQDRRARSGELESARAQFAGEHYCPACHARNEIERSQLSLAVAALALSAVRERYVRSHGLCVKHAVQARSSGVGQLIVAHAGACLDVLGWELEERGRKDAWACRHETSGPERDAWLRAMAHVDGRVFEGGPAPRELG